MSRLIPQKYPRDSEGLLDISKLASHRKSLTKSSLKKIVEAAIKYADSKASEDVFRAVAEPSSENRRRTAGASGSELLRHFQKYCIDPAQTALDTHGLHYSEVAVELAKNRLIQVMRMNVGWRYQYIAKDTASRTGRFLHISDLGGQESDFNAVTVMNNGDQLAIYVSVKNRTSTMGGQDWPKAIAALEKIAVEDRNRGGAYICVFGMAIEKGQRNIKKSNKSKQPHSMNTEHWMADFFWPFFSNKSFDEIAKAVLIVLKSKNRKAKDKDDFVPKDVIDSFGAECRKYGLVNENGVFHDEIGLVEFLCGKVKKCNPKRTK